SFRSETTDLMFEEDRGSILTMTPSTRSASYAIGFGFPFNGTSVHTIYVSQFCAVYLAPPPALPPNTHFQYTEAELTAMTTPVVAALLTPTRGQNSFPPTKVYVRQESDRVVVTWYEPTHGQDVQA